MLAKLLAKEIKIAPGPFVIALVGNIGTGKTTFIQGLARGLDIHSRLTSPTFVLMKYISIPRIKRILIHIDAYRLKNSKEFSSIAGPDIFSNKTHITVVEWATKIRQLLGKNVLWISIKHTRHENERIITLERK